MIQIKEIAAFTAKHKVPGPHIRRLSACVAAIISVFFQVHAQDTLLLKVDNDTVLTTARLPDSSNTSDSLKAVDSGKVSSPVKAADSIDDSLTTRINFDSCTIIGAGIGLSVGSIPVFSLWKKGLPQSLAGFGITESFMRSPPDTAPLAFSPKENPDIYNMVFPLSISIDRCFPQARIGTALSFSMISKKYAASIITPADSSRRIDIRNQLGLYTLTLDLLYGRKIPARYFSVDGVDRTDAIVGISIAPLLALGKTSSVKSVSPDPRFAAIADSLSKGTGSFSSYGVAFGWRAGMMTLRRLSNQGGIEAGISYFGVWSGRFRTRGMPLVEKQVSRTGSDDQDLGSVSHRIEISVALVRKAF